MPQSFCMPQQPASAFHGLAHRRSPDEAEAALAQGAAPFKVRLQVAWEAAVDRWLLLGGHNIPNVHAGHRAR